MSVTLSVNLESSQLVWIFSVKTATIRQLEMIRLLDLTFMICIMSVNMSQWWGDITSVYWMDEIGVDGQTQHQGWFSLVRYKHSISMVQPYYHVFNTLLSKSIFLPFPHRVHSNVTVVPHFHHLLMMMMAWTVFHDASNVLEIALCSSPDQYHLTVRFCTCFVSSLPTTASAAGWRCQENHTETADLYLRWIRFTSPMTGVW